MAWHIITAGDDVNSNYKEFLIDFDSDIETPPDKNSYSLSSLAHTPGFARMWESDANGNWIEIGGEDE